MAIYMVPSDPQPCNIIKKLVQYIKIRCDSWQQFADVRLMKIPSQAGIME